MKTLKNFFAAFALTAVLTFGATGANAGIIVAGISGEGDPCTESSVATKDGIIVAGITGIIVAGFTGIIVAGAQEETVDCGIIVAG